MSEPVDWPGELSPADLDAVSEPGGPVAAALAWVEMVLDGRIAESWSATGFCFRLHLARHWAWNHRAPLHDAGYDPLEVATELADAGPAHRPALEPDLRVLIEGHRLDPAGGGVVVDERSPDGRLLGPALGNGGQPPQRRRAERARETKHRLPPAGRGGSGGSTPTGVYPTGHRYARGRRVCGAGYGPARAGMPF